MGSKKTGHTIKVTSHMTGVSIETLRVWERRYGFPRPHREESGRRLYSDDDVRRVRLVARAVAQGFRPGDVISKPEDEVSALLAPPAPPPAPSLDSEHTPELLSALRIVDLGNLQRRLRQLALSFGPKRFVMQVAQPFAVAVGQAWVRGEIGVHHEHLATEVLMTELRVLLATLEPEQPRPRLLLAALPGEEHALALELVAVYAAASGVRVRVLGLKSPPLEIVRAAEALGVAAVGVTLTAPPEETKPAAALAELARKLPKSMALWLGGQYAASVTAPKSSRIVQSWDALDQALQTV